MSLKVSIISGDTVLEPVEIKNLSLEVGNIAKQVATVIQVNLIDKDLNPIIFSFKHNDRILDPTHKIGDCNIKNGDQLILTANGSIVSTSFNTKHKETSVYSQFDFPNEIKVHCEQYLIYFVTFLREVGINSTSSLKEEAGKVLFSVTPTDDFGALDKIREALAVYLNLPSRPVIYDESFASMRLKQQVDNLQHAQKMTEMEIRSSHYTLRLAQQTIESQDKIILQKDITIEQQNKIIERITSKSIMTDSAENKEELQKVFDGLEVGESKFIKEKLGIKLNPAKMIKTMVENTLGKGDEIIELGLDKKE